jgi:CheY-like chemotaxis protein
MSKLLEGLRILVVEDELLTALDLARMIEECGGEVVGPVGRLEQAQELARREQIDAAILDVQLDGQTSLALAEELLSRDLPVLLTTGYESDMLPDRLSETARLNKPYSDGDFLRIARQHLVRRSRSAARSNA